MWNQNVITFLVSQKFVFSKVLYILFIWPFKKLYLKSQILELLRKEIEPGLDFICLSTSAVTVGILLLARSRGSAGAGHTGAVPRASQGEVRPKWGQLERPEITEVKR